MKKLIAAMLVLVLVLAGCSAKDSVVGTWQTQVDMTSLYDELMEGMDEELKQYFTFGEFSYIMTVTFREDGTYAIVMDQASVETAVDSLVASLEEGMLNALQAQLTESGIDMSVEEVLASTGQTISDLMTGIDAESMVAELTTGSEGNYKAEEGKLFLSTGLDTAVDEAIYDTYELEGDTLTLTEHFGSDSEDALADGMYPMVFTRTE